MFVVNSIKKGSTILSKGWNGNQILFAEDYVRGPYTSKLLHVDRIHKNLVRFLNRKLNNQKIRDKNLAESLIREFCQKFNAKIVETDFYELLQKMIQVKPITDLSDNR